MIQELKTITTEVMIKIKLKLLLTNQLFVNNPLY